MAERGCGCSRLMKFQIRVFFHSCTRRKLRVLRTSSRLPVQESGHRFCILEIGSYYDNKIPADVKCVGLW